MQLTDRQEALVESAKEQIDRVGAALSKEAWIELCEDVSSYFDASAEAARDELLDD